MHEHAHKIGSDGTKHRDPVCGMTVDETASHRREYDGKTVLFCSAHCASKFDRAPDQYIAAEPPQTQPATAGTYTCPMHPEVRAESPGDCPKCGMALEPEMPPPA